MSDFTDARSRPGARLNTGTDDRELFLLEFGQMVLDAWTEVNNYENLSYQRTILTGKADTFPIIGRKRDAVEHTPGEIILGGTIESNEVQIALDKMLIDSVFIAEIDELMAHYDLAAPYAKQLGESLSTTYDKRCAIMHILASRVTVAPYTGGPVPSFYTNVNLKTDASQLETAAFKAVEYIKARDIGGGSLGYMLPWQQYLLLARYTGIEAYPVTTGTGNRAKGTVGQIAGTDPQPTNHIPSTNITDGNTKFRGDFTPTVGHISNQMAVGTLNRRGMKVVIKDQDDRLGTLIIASKFNGMDKLRPECAFELSTTRT